MTIKYKHFSLIFIGLFLLSSFALTSISPLAQAACSPDSLPECTASESCVGNGGHFGYSGSVMTCSPAAAGEAKGDPAATGGKCSDLSNCDLISRYINPGIQLFSAIVGIAVAISIVVGGIQYAASAGDPAAAAAAKARIRNAIIALISFLFLYALLNFLIPGGVFHG